MPLRLLRYSAFSSPDALRLMAQLFLRLEDVLRTRLLRLQLRSCDRRASRFSRRFPLEIYLGAEALPRQFSCSFDRLRVCPGVVASRRELRSLHSMQMSLAKSPRFLLSRRSRTASSPILLTEKLLRSIQ